MEKKASDTPWICIIILNWNGLQDTLACIESLQALDYPSFDIILVDNGSTDGSPDILRKVAKENPKIKLILNEENLGFSGGCNIGIQVALKSNADYILLLNNDTRVSPNFLKLLVESAKNHPKAGITGPKVYIDKQEQTLYCAGGSLWKTLGQPFMRGHAKIDHGQYNQEKEVGFISGCCLLIKREVIEKIGVLDEDYFAFFEDLDWNVRAHQAGYASLYVPSSIIWHKGSNSLGLKSPAYYFLHARNRILFAKKHASFLLFWSMFVPYFFIYRYLWTGFSLMSKNKWGHVLAIHQGIISAMTGSNRHLFRLFKP